MAICTNPGCDVRVASHKVKCTTCGTLNEKYGKKYQLYFIPYFVVTMLMVVINSSTLHLPIPLALKLIIPFVMTFSGGFVFGYWVGLPSLYNAIFISMIVFREGIMSLVTGRLSVAHSVSVFITLCIFIALIYGGSIVGAKMKKSDLSETE